MGKDICKETEKKTADYGLQWRTAYVMTDGGSNMGDTTTDLVRHIYGTVKVQVLFINKNTVWKDCKFVMCYGPSRFYVGVLISP